MDDQQDIDDAAEHQQELDEEAHREMIRAQNRELNERIKTHPYTCICNACMTVGEYVTDREQEKMLIDRYRRN